MISGKNSKSPIEQNSTAPACRTPRGQIAEDVYCAQRARKRNDQLAPLLTATDQQRQPIKKGKQRKCVTRRGLRNRRNSILNPARLPIPPLWQVVVWKGIRSVFLVPMFTPHITSVPH
jgi:hypothetical protein